MFNPESNGASVSSAGYTQVEIVPNSYSGAARLADQEWADWQAEESRQIPPFRYSVNRAIKADNPALPYSQILGANLPSVFATGHDGKPTCDYETIAGFNIPKINDLTGAETIYYEWLQKPIRATQERVAAAIRVLGEKLLEEIADINHLRAKAEPPEPPIEQTIAYAVASVYEIFAGKTNPAFVKFEEKQVDAIGEIYRIAAEASDQANADIMKATFMICHRCEPAWELMNTLSLSRGAIKAICAFWDLEANGGKLPEPKIEETTPPVEEVPDKLAEEKPDEVESSAQGKPIAV